MNSLAVVSGASLAYPVETEPMRFSSEQRAMIRDTFANGASESEFAVLMEVASARRLNPLLRQIHFVKRYDSQKKREVWATQAAIDGLRAIAQRTGLYAGQDEPEYVEQDGLLMVAKVRVYRKDWTRASVGVAYWSEYVQTTRDGTPTRFWQAMPHVMLAKCAEALALRKAFPEDMSGLYVPEEMGQAENDTPRLQAPRVEVANAFDALCDKLDTAEVPAAINAVAIAAKRAVDAGALTATQFETLRDRASRKRKFLAGDESASERTVTDATTEAAQ